MRNKSKITTLESKFPLLSIEQGCMVSKDADITVAFRVELPELFTVTSAEYEAMHSAWHKAIKVLPNYSIVHKQDWFIKEDYQGKLSDGGLSFLARSSERHFNERPYLHHSVYLFLTKTNKQRMAQQSNFSSLCRGHLIPKEITNKDLTEAFERVAIGPERKSKVMNDEEKKLTAYHEAGHAVVGHVLPDSDPVHKITIIPRGHTGGVTWFLPPEDRSYKNIYELKDVMARAMGGRIAEKIIFGEDRVTTGASSDLKHIAELSKDMILREGLGTKTRNQVFPADEASYYALSSSKPYSEKTAELIDQEMRAFTDEAAKRAEAVLLANREILDRVANALLEKETLEEEDLKDIFEGSKLPKEAKLY